MKAYGEVEVGRHTFLISALDGGGVVSLMPWLFYQFTRMWVAQLMWMFWGQGKTVAPARNQTVIFGLISQA